MASVQLIIEAYESFWNRSSAIEAKYETTSGIFEILAKFLASILHKRGICKLLAPIFNEPKHNTFFSLGVL